MENLPENIASNLQLLVISYPGHSEWVGHVFFFLKKKNPKKPRLGCVCESEMIVRHDRSPSSKQWPGVKSAKT